jgi:excisionase family DNA binding protein
VVRVSVKTTDELLDAVRENRAGADDTPVVLRVGDVEYELDGKIRDAVLGLLSVASPDRVVDITTLPVEITTGQAADLLGVSRPTLVQLVERGELPATRVGARRRLRTIDVLEFRKQRDTRRPAGIGEIIAASEDLGLYD